MLVLDAGQCVGCRANFAALMHRSTLANWAPLLLRLTLCPSCAAAAAMFMNPQAAAPAGAQGWESTKYCRQHCTTLKQLYLITKEFRNCSKLKLLHC